MFQGMLLILSSWVGTYAIVCMFVLEGNHRTNEEQRKRPLLLLLGSSAFIAIASIANANGGVFAPRECQYEKTSKADGRHNRVALCVTGSVASVKLPELVRCMLGEGMFVDVVLTEAADFFMKSKYKGTTAADEMVELLKLKDKSDGTPRVVIWRDEDEWMSYSRVGKDDVVHVNLAKRNRLLVIAPLSANTLAKIVHGYSSNLLTSLVRAWYWNLNDIVQKRTPSRPLLVAPAMNTYMWHKDITRAQIRAIEKMGAVVVHPQTKLLACGDFGSGAMADPTDILYEALRIFPGSSKGGTAGAGAR
eukprot:g881.t1